jgi:hypothetical protein
MLAIKMLAISIKSYENKSNSMKGYPAYQVCINACLHCAAVSNHCALSCTTEEDIKMMARCIQLDMECSVICYATASLMSLDSEKATAICGICADVCEACANECSLHDNEHCRQCADACTACAAECKNIAA